MSTEKAIFGAGCFWHVEEEFMRTPGVVRTMVGYCGGHVENPSYDQVCSGATGHAEVVQVEYDPKVIPFDDLLNVFWAVHDPTTVNRQGPDVGHQYRSVIFFFTPDQEKIAKASKKKLDSSKRFSNPIVTEVLPAKSFYKGEEYHQKYFCKLRER